MLMTRNDSNRLYSIAGVLGVSREHVRNRAGCPHLESQQPTYLEAPSQLCPPQPARQPVTTSVAADFLEKLEAGATLIKRQA